MGSMDDQSLFDTYENQKVPTGRPKSSDEPWTKKRALDPEFEDFHIPPKRALFNEDATTTTTTTKQEQHDPTDDKRVIVPAGGFLWVHFVKFISRVQLGFIEGQIFTTA